MVETDGQIQICVRAYIRTVREEKRCELQHYAQQATLEDAIALTLQGQRHPHQRRLNQQVLVTVRDNLLQELQALRDSVSFDAILAIVHACSVPGFGELARYDTALRIGAWRSLLPDKVYMHAGTRIGARNLGLDVSRGYLVLDEIPVQLRQLEPYEIEDALCLYKGDLVRRAPVLQGRSCLRKKRRGATCSSTPRITPHTSVHGALRP